MKLRLACALFASLVTMPAMAQNLDFSKIKCKDFVAAPKDQIGTILVWLEGYYTKENSPPIMYEDKTKKDAAGLATYCATHGEDDVITAAEAVMPVK